MPVPVEFSIERFRLLLDRVRARFVSNEADQELRDFLWQHADTLLEYSERMEIGPTLTCVYCGLAYPPGTPAHGAALLTEHIKVCERHPMRASEQRIVELEQRLALVADLAHDRDGDSVGWRSNRLGTCAGIVLGGPVGPPDPGVIRHARWAHDKLREGGKEP